MYNEYTFKIERKKTEKKCFTGLNTKRKRLNLVFEDKEEVTIIDYFFNFCKGVIQIIRDTHMGMGGKTKCHIIFFAVLNSYFKAFSSKK